MTYQERLIAGLESRGFERIQTKSKKYITFCHSSYSQVYMVEPAGALRVGRNVSNSISVGDPTRQTPEYVALLVDGDKKLSLS